MSVYQCPGCGYQFNEAVGDEYEGYPPNTLFDSLPEDFVCPDCAVRQKSDFVCVTETTNLSVND